MKRSFIVLDEMDKRESRSRVHGVRGQVFEALDKGMGLGKIIEDLSKQKTVLNIEIAKQWRHEWSQARGSR